MNTPKIFDKLTMKKQIEEQLDEQRNPDTEEVVVKEETRPLTIISSDSVEFRINSQKDYRECSYIKVSYSERNTGAQFDVEATIGIDFRISVNIQNIGGFSEAGCFRNLEHEFAQSRVDLNKVLDEVTTALRIQVGRERFTIEQRTLKFVKRTATYYSKDEEYAKITTEIGEAHMRIATTLKWLETFTNSLQEL